MEGTEEDIGATFLSSDQYVIDGHVGHGHQHDDDEKDDVASSEAASDGTCGVGFLEPVVVSFQSFPY